MSLKHVIYFTVNSKTKYNSLIYQNQNIYTLVVKVILNWINNDFLSFMTLETSAVS